MVHGYQICRYTNISVALAYIYETLLSSFKVCKHTHCAPVHLDDSHVREASCMPQFTIRNELKLQQAAVVVFLKSEL
jgi:hypothetical protein